MNYKYVRLKLIHFKTKVADYSFSKAAYVTMLVHINFSLKLKFLLVNQQH